MAASAKLRWVADADLSAAHASYVVATGRPCANERTEALLLEPVRSVNNRLVSSSIDAGVFWAEYFSGILSGAKLEQSCSVALLAGGCSELSLEPFSKAVAHHLSDARHSFLQQHPKLKPQLELRSQPLRDRWEEVGRDLLRAVGQQIWQASTPRDWWPSRVTALIVQPMNTGDGGFVWQPQRVWLEAIINEPDNQVPEVLRVAYLITRIAIEKHIRGLSDQVQLSKAWSLASVPLVLTAGTSLDLLANHNLPIDRAIAGWNHSELKAAPAVADWWATYQQTLKPLPVALRDLADALP